MPQRHNSEEIGAVDGVKPGILLPDGWLHSPRVMQV